MIFIFLACHHWLKSTLFDAWYFSFIIFRVYLTFVKAVIIILKHASFLLLSNLSAKSALTQAEIDYQAENTALKIQQFLTESPQEHTVEHFAQFIMENDIGLLFLLLRSCQG
jgi:hypothetical protein